MRRSPSESYRAAARISARRALQYSRYSRLMIADMTELRRLHPVLDASDGALPGDVVASGIRFRRRGIWLRPPTGDEIASRVRERGEGS